MNHVYSHNVLSLTSLNQLGLLLFIKHTQSNFDCARKYVSGRHGWEFLEHSIVNNNVNNNTGSDSSSSGAYTVFSDAPNIAANAYANAYGILSR